MAAYVLALALAALYCAAYTAFEIKKGPFASALLAAMLTVMPLALLAVSFA